MAEKISLYELDIDTDKAVKDLKALKEEQAVLSAQAKKAKEEQGELSEEYIKYSSALKTVQTDVRTQERLLQNLTAAQFSNEGSLEQMKQQLAVVTIEWNKLSKEERKNSEYGQQLTKQKLELTEALKAEERATGDARRNVGNYTEAINQLSPALGPLASGFGGATKATQTFKVSLDVLKAHPIIAIITLLVALLGGLFKAFTRTQEGSDKLNKVLGQLKAMMDVIVGIIAEFATTIISAFEDPKKAISDLWQYIKTELVERWQAMVQMFQSSAKLIGAALKFNWDEVKKHAKEAGEAFLTMNGLDDVIEGAKKLKMEFEENAIAAGKIYDMQVAIRRAQIALTEDNAKYVKQIAELKLIEADRANSLEERLEASKLAVEVENKRMEAQLAYQKQILAVAIAEMEAAPVNLRNDEQRLKIAEERARLAEIEAGSLEKRKELVTKIAELEAQIAKRDMDAALEEIEAELAAYAESAEDKLNIANEAIKKADEDRKLNLERLRTDLENQLIIYADNEEKKLELQREMLEMQRMQELEMADKTGADKKLIEEKYAILEQQLEMKKAAAKADIQKSFTDNLAVLFGKQSKVGKAAAVASTTIETFKGAQSAFSAMSSIPIVGPVLGGVAAAAASAIGLANVKKIMSTKSGLPGEGGGGGAVPSAAAAPVPINIAPSVGQGLASRDSSTNQTDMVKEGVAAALREVPMQPTLVVDSVSAAQSTEYQRSATSVL